MKEYITKFMPDEMMAGKNFWNDLRPYLTNKRTISWNEIYLFEGEN